jgi:hypothetical protein
MRKILSTLLLFVFFFLIIAQPSLAQSPTAGVQENKASEYLAPNTDDDVPKNLNTWTQSVMLSVLSAAVCQLAGIDVMNPQNGCLGVDSETGKIGYVKSGGGLIGITAMAIGATYTPPLHTGDYIKYISSNFGIAKLTQAQGFGFQALNPLVEIWSLFRNIAYAVLIVVFLVIGLAIMLRVRIDPRTVMTIQNQIPKVIIALLAITFSFAIAGFLIDLMYVVIFLIYSTFSGLLGGILDPSFIQGKSILETGGQSVVGTFNIPHNIALGGKDVLKDILNIDQGEFGGLGSVAQTLGALFGIVDWNSFSLGDYLTNIITFGISLQIASLIPCAGESIPVLGGLTCVGQTAAETAILFPLVRLFFTDVVPYIIVFVIILIAILFALFRTLFMLIMAYVLILVDVIFAPLWIIAGLIPGNNSLGFGAWVRDLVANLSVFPVVYLMLILATLLSNAFTGQIGFTPPLIGNPLAGSFISAIIGLGILLLMPQAANMVKAAIKAPSLPTQGMAKPLQSSAAVAGALAGGVWGRMFYRYTDREGRVRHGGRLYDAWVRLRERGRYGPGGGTGGAGGTSSGGAGTAGAPSGGGGTPGTPPPRGPGAAAAAAMAARRRVTQANPSEEARARRQASLDQADSGARLGFFRNRRRGS